MITPLTIVRFLLFQRQAIESLARSRKALIVGLLLVLSAGFAREYDGEYLVIEPWHLALPLLASLIGCTAMVLAVSTAAYGRGIRDVSIGRMFLSFLSLYWMTAPLAWLYAIPFERLMNPAEATNANLWLLGLVAAWRVALMVRCVQVVCGASWGSALFPVMLFSDALALLALKFVPGPIFMVMGGVRLSESEDMIVGMRVMAGFFGVVTLPVWIIGFMIVCGIKTRWKWFDEKANVESTQSGSSISVGTWAVVAVSLLVWVPILPRTQAEQRLRWEAERLIHAGDYAGFVTLANAHPENAFPPHWDPPPRVGYGESEPPVFAVTVAMNQNKAPRWIQTLYESKVERYAFSHRHFWVELDEYSDEELEEFVSMVAQLENAKAIASNYTNYAKYALDKEELNEKRRTALMRLQELAGKSE